MQIIFLKLKSRIFNLQLRQKKVMYTICPCFLHKNYPFFQFLLFLLSCYVQYQSSANYSSTLAHKINHSFKPNCDWVHSVHPCYGRIPAVQTIQVFYTFIHSFILIVQAFIHPSLQILVFIHPFILGVFGIHPSIHSCSLSIYSYIHPGSFMHSFILTFWQCRHLFTWQFGHPFIHSSWQFRHPYIHSLLLQHLNLHSSYSHIIHPSLIPSYVHYFFY